MKKCYNCRAEHDLDTLVCADAKVNQSKAHLPTSSMTEYKPVNNNVVIELITEETTSSGIILTQNKATYYKVVATNEDCNDILGKLVILSKEPIRIESNFFVAPIDTIVACK